MGRQTYSLNFYLSVKKVIFMKVLLVERSMVGHRKTYLENLYNIEGIEFFVFAPENFGVDDKHFYKYGFAENKANFSNYFKWTKKINSIVKKEKIDIVHILDGDSIMRWFGFGLHRNKSSKVLITYHHFFPGFLRKISYKMMCRKGNACVAHTDSVKESLEAYSLSNVYKCEYPAFDFEKLSSLNKNQCKIDCNVPLETPTIGIVGGLCKYKNILQFLKVLQKLDDDFYVLISGKDSDITVSEIKDVISTYSDKVMLNIKRLTDEEYHKSIAASDIIFCIYGYDFDGASGPLTDGVCAQKMILSCNHGSLGNIVRQNSLGFTAICDDETDILNKTKAALNEVSQYKYNKEANNFRDKLKPAMFKDCYKMIYNDLL